MCDYISPFVKSYTDFNVNTYNVNTYLVYMKKS